MLLCFNRKPLPKNANPPVPPSFPPDAITRGVMAEVAALPGTGRVDGFNLAVTRQQALAAFNDFLARRLAGFGPYEDAMIETIITHLLDAAGVPYRRLEHSEPVYTIETAAAQRGVVRSEMVKSILLRESGGRRRYTMACVLGDARLDPKAVREHLPAAAGDWRRLTFASDEEIRRMTPGEKGAVAPLGLAPEIPVVFDQAIAACVNVNISSGNPWLGLELAAQDLIRLAGAQTTAIAHHGV